MNVLGLPADDPLAMVPVGQQGRTDVAGQLKASSARCLDRRRRARRMPGSPEMTMPVPSWMPPWMQALQRPRQCSRTRCRTARCSASATTRRRRCSHSCRPRRCPPVSCLRLPPRLCIAPGPADDRDRRRCRPRRGAARSRAPRLLGPQGVGPAPGPPPPDRGSRPRANRPARLRLHSAVMSEPPTELESADPRRAGQGDRPRAAKADHRARHGQERRRRLRRQRARRDVSDHLGMPEEGRRSPKRSPPLSPTCQEPARSRSAST